MIEVVNCHHKLTPKSQGNIIVRSMKKRIMPEQSGKQNLFLYCINGVISEHVQFAQSFRNLAPEFSRSVKHEMRRIALVTHPLQKSLEINPDPGMMKHAYIQYYRGKRCHSSALSKQIL